MNTYDKDAVLHIIIRNKTYWGLDTPNGNHMFMLLFPRLLKDLPEFKARFKDIVVYKVEKIKVTKKYIELKNPNSVTSIPNDNKDNVYIIYSNTNMLSHYGRNMYVYDYNNKEYEGGLAIRMGKEYGKSLPLRAAMLHAVKDIFKNTKIDLSYIEEVTRLTNNEFKGYDEVDIGFTYPAGGVSFRGCMNYSNFNTVMCNKGMLLVDLIEKSPDIIATLYKFWDKEFIMSLCKEENMRSVADILFKFDLKDTSNAKNEYTQSQSYIRQAILNRLLELSTIVVNRGMGKPAEGLFVPEDDRVSRGILDILYLYFLYYALYVYGDTKCDKHISGLRILSISNDNKTDTALAIVMCDMYTKALEDNIKCRIVTVADDVLSKGFISGNTIYSSRIAKTPIFKNIAILYRSEFRDYMATIPYNILTSNDFLLTEIIGCAKNYVNSDDPENYIAKFYITILNNIK